ncbi:mitochondrial 39-S ribosomal protein L47 (MRP-L47)-domain-containing protein [Poronia punctata]|nr:mitochondrial 39-S ribosomal protein L47 (MRP-L47)-domain-containing protein [Poronia punctata]
MAASGSLRSSICRIVHPTKIFPTGHTTIGIGLSTASSQKCSFSSTPEYNNRRPRRDNNRLRGLSSIYRSGTRFRMNIDKEDVPAPTKYKPKVKVDPNHGLWDFFYSKDSSLITPDESTEHGRGWTVEELRHKSWEDLHKLWWVCIKEQNRIFTLRKERSRLKLPEGAEEGAARLREVRTTMRSIRHALTERWYAWEDARKLAETDPEIDLNNTQSPFTPKDYLEEELPVENTTPTGDKPAGFMAEEPAPSKPTEAQEPVTKP